MSSLGLSAAHACHHSAVSSSTASFILYWFQRREKRRGCGDTEKVARKRWWRNGCLEKQRTRGTSLGLPFEGVGSADEVINGGVLKRMPPLASDREGERRGRGRGRDRNCSGEFSSFLLFFSLCFLSVAVAPALPPSYRDVNVDVCMCVCVCGLFHSEKGAFGFSLPTSFFHPSLLSPLFSAFTT